MPASPASLVISRFGGAAKCSKLTGRSRSTIYRWLAKGRVDQGAVDDVLRLARKHRVKLTRSEVLLGV